VDKDSRHAEFGCQVTGGVDADRLRNEGAVARVVTRFGALQLELERDSGRDAALEDLCLEIDTMVVFDPVQSPVRT